MKTNTQIITRSAFILALAMAVQMVKLPQPVTGPVVNALLFIAASVVGPLGAVLIGLCTPVLAFAFGIMPFAPAVFIIMLGNASLVLTYWRLAKRRVIAFGVAAIVKFFVMWALVMYIVPVIFGIKVPAKIIGALTTPQLFTALGGAALAYVILEALKGFTKNKD